MSQEEHVIHTNAEGQEGQDLTESSQCQWGDMVTVQDGTWPPRSPQGPTSPTVSGSSPSTYLCGGCVEGDAQQ